MIAEVIDMHAEKEIARRMQVFLRDHEFVSIAKEFGGDVFRRSSALYGLHDFLDACSVRADVCIEIGSWNGITAQVLSRFCNSVISIDVVNNQDKYLIDAYVSSLRGRKSRIEFVNCSKENVASVIASRKFDFAFMDGDHAKETQGNWESVRHCGSVLFHEVWPSQPPVWALVQSLPQSEVKYGAFNFALWRKTK